MKRKIELSAKTSPKIKLLRKAFFALAVDPFLKGINIRSRASHLRSQLSIEIEKALYPLKPSKIHAQITDFDLYGGIDISNSIKEKELTKRTGIFGNPSQFIYLSMSERIGSSLAGKICLAIDKRQTSYVISLDEGLEDERTPYSILDRLAFAFDLNDERQLQRINLSKIRDNLPEIRSRLFKVHISEKMKNQFSITALALGVTSLRAPIFALRTARALAAIRGKSFVSKNDFVMAIQLTLAHKATQIPRIQEPQKQEEEQEETNDTKNKENNDPSEMDIPQEMIINAIESTLPKDVLGEIKLLSPKKDTLNSNASGSGQRKLGNRRGSPKPSRKMPFDTSKRLDLISTLRSAAPWQKLRRELHGSPDNSIIIYKDDLFVRQYEEKSDRLIIFTVDASGSNAIGRLGEAKGAIEYLLGEAYANRDHVSLIAFRGTKAEVLLPATRSLVQAKKKLADLPGGGGTPIASGLEKAVEISITARNKGLTPTIAIMTDGKANISLEGQVDKKQALSDSEKFCMVIQNLKIPAIVIDTSNRPQQPAKDLAQKANAKYIPMPRADAKKLSNAISKSSNEFHTNQ